MQPWKISAGLTAAIAGSAVLLAGPRLEYLAPYWPLILAEHGVLLALHLALALAAVAAAIYAVARAAGLADLGRRADGTRPSTQPCAHTSRRVRRDPASHLADAGQGAPPVRGRHSGRHARKLRGRARGHAPGEGRDHALADGGSQGERLLR